MRLLAPTTMIPAHREGGPKFTRTMAWLHDREVCVSVSLAVPGRKLSLGGAVTRAPRCHRCEPVFARSGRTRPAAHRLRNVPMRRRTMGLSRHTFAFGRCLRGPAAHSLRRATMA